MTRLNKIRHCFLQRHFAITYSYYTHQLKNLGYPSATIIGHILSRWNRTIFLIPHTTTEDDKINNIIESTNEMRMRAAEACSAWSTNCLPPSCAKFHIASCSCITIDEQWNDNILVYTMYSSKTFLLIAVIKLSTAYCWCQSERNRNETLDNREKHVGRWEKTKHGNHADDASFVAYNPLSLAWTLAKLSMYCMNKMSAEKVIGIGKVKIGPAPPITISDISLALSIVFFRMPIKWMDGKKIDPLLLAALVAVWFLLRISQLRHLNKHMGTWSYHCLLAFDDIHLE